MKQYKKLKNKVEKLPNSKIHKGKLRMFGLLFILFFLAWVIFRMVSQPLEKSPELAGYPPTAKQAAETPITESLIAKVKSEPETAGYFSDFYNRVTVFPDFKNYLASREEPASCNLLLRLLI